MAPTTKEAQRAELHKTIWRIANDLRGSVDGWDFKSYVLGMLFYRFISENLTAYLNKNEHDAGEVSRFLADRALARGIHGVEVRMSVNGNDAAALGAATLVLQDRLSPRSLRSVTFA